MIYENVSPVDGVKGNLKKSKFLSEKLCDGVKAKSHTLLQRQPVILRMHSHVIIVYHANVSFYVVKYRVTKLVTCYRYNIEFQQMISCCVTTCLILQRPHFCDILPQCGKAKTTLQFM